MASIFIPVVIADAASNRIIVTCVEWNKADDLEIAVSDFCDSNNIDFNSVVWQTAPVDDANRPIIETDQSLFITSIQ